MRHALMAASAALLLFPQVAQADDAYTVHCQLDWAGAEHCRARPIIRNHPRTRVYSYVRRARDEDKYVRPEAARREEREYAITPPPGHDAVCRAEVSVVGSQGLTENAARESAEKGWAEQVRFAHGEIFMDLKNAQGLASRCTRSSIGEVMNQTMHRCQLVARPCRSEMKAADRD